MADDFCDPWTAHFERDGTEDVAVIRDADGADLVTSRGLWLPEGGDATPPALAAVRLMAAAPQLFRALENLLEQTIGTGRRYGMPLSEREVEAEAGARPALAAACGTVR